MPMPPRVRTAPPRPAVQGQLIVARDHLELYHSLQHAFGDSPEVTILLDRRCEKRRRHVQPVAGDRWRSERRTLLHMTDDPRVRHYVLVRPHYRRPHD
jgi:hypothetical protein